MFPDALSYPPRVVGTDAAAVSKTSPELTGDVAARRTPVSRWAGLPLC